MVITVILYHIVRDYNGDYCYIISHYMDYFHTWNITYGIVLTTI